MTNSGFHHPDRKGEVWINRSNLPVSVANIYAEYPDNRQGRRAAERKMARVGITKEEAQVAKAAYDRAMKAQTTP